MNLFYPKSREAARLAAEFFDDCMVAPDDPRHELCERVGIALTVAVLRCVERELACAHDVYALAGEECGAEYPDDTEILLELYGEGLPWHWWQAAHAIVNPQDELKRKRRAY